MQEVKETTCEYLQHLHLLAPRTVNTGGMKTADIAKEVMCHFECSCANEDFLHCINIQGLCN